MFFMDFSVKKNVLHTRLWVIDCSATNCKLCGSNSIFDHYNCMYLDHGIDIIVLT